MQTEDATLPASWLQAIDERFDPVEGVLLSGVARIDGGRRIEALGGAVVKTLRANRVRV